MKKNELIKLLIDSITENDDSEDCNMSSDLFKIGEQYFIRTVTYHALGVCKKIVDGFILLDKAIWVADSGRFSNALKEGFNKQPSAELEPINGILHVNINSIVDFVKYEPKIIIEQK